MGRKGGLEGKEKQEEEQKKTGGEKKRGSYQKGPPSGLKFALPPKKNKNKMYNNLLTANTRSVKITTSSDI